MALPRSGSFRKLVLALALLAVTDNLQIHAFNIDAQKLARGGYTSTGLIPFPRTGRSVEVSEPEAAAEAPKHLFGLKPADDLSSYYYYNYYGSAKPKRQRLVPFPRTGKRQALIPFPRTGKRAAGVYAPARLSDVYELLRTAAAARQQAENAEARTDLADLTSEPGKELGNNYLMELFSPALSREGLDYDSTFPVVGTGSDLEDQPRMRRIYSN